MFLMTAGPHPQFHKHWSKINLTKQVRAARQSLHLLQRDRERDEPNAGNNLGDSRRNSGRAQTVIGFQALAFQVIRYVNVSGFHPHWSLGGGQRLRFWNRYPRLAHIPLSAYCPFDKVPSSVNANVQHSCIIRNAVKALQILSLALLTKLVDLRKQKKRFPSLFFCDFRAFRSEKLIHQMLPKTVAENLKYGRATSEMFESATILFSEVYCMLAASAFVLLSVFVLLLYLLLSVFDPLLGDWRLQRPCPDLHPSWPLWDAWPDLQNFWCKNGQIWCFQGKLTFLSHHMRDYCRLKQSTIPTWSPQAFQCEMGTNTLPRFKTWASWTIIHLIVSMDFRLRTSPSTWWL